ncbi:hypothetical protein TNCV_4589071 [Trichonephila clavipes]|nr:hypothetical protein TNCV_4589071 [Trichonephila clavipes]
MAKSELAPLSSNFHANGQRFEPRQIERASAPSPPLHCGSSAELVSNSLYTCHETVTLTTKLPRKLLSGTRVRTHDTPSTSS